MFYITSVPLSIHLVFSVYNLEVRFSITMNIITIYCIVRSRDKINHMFIHLNLCIALALGLVVFIAGIESATTNEVCVITNDKVCNGYNLFVIAYRVFAS